jgi:hypothetical protein
MNFQELQYKIENLLFPEHWREEGAEPPNRIAKDNAYLCCSELWLKYDLFPIRLATTIESGVYLVFKRGTKELLIETYNDGDVGALVCQDKQILHNEDIVEFDFSKCIYILNKE